MYAVWRYNGHRLGDAINHSGHDFEDVPQFVIDSLTDTFQKWDAEERAAS